MIILREYQFKTIIKVSIIIIIITIDKVGNSSDIYGWKPKSLYSTASYYLHITYS